MPETKRTVVYLTEEASRLLGELAPSERKRGQYLSDLIVRTAQGAGVELMPLPPESLSDAELLAELRRRVEEIEDHLEAPGLRRLADAAVAEGGAPIPVERVLAELAV